MRHNFWYKEVLKNNLASILIWEKMSKIFMFVAVSKIFNNDSAGNYTKPPFCRGGTVFSRQKALKINLHHFTRREK